MLTVWCVLNGDKYSDRDVYLLRDQVRRNLKTAHQFRCLSDRLIPGIDCLIIGEQWPGWWAKLQLFRVEHGAALYLDLDCVVVGDLAPLISHRLSMPENWAQSGNGGCQSSVMSWGGNHSWIADKFEPHKIGPARDGHCGLYGPRELWGDQEYITDIAGAPGYGEITHMSGVYSYKYHCQSGLPKDARVICFHGQPKPADVSDAWVIAARSST